VRPIKLINIASSWNGKAIEEQRLKAKVELLPGQGGYWLNALAQVSSQLPPEPPGWHPRLYDYDVVECFLVGPEGYLEVELGPGGHFLALSFDRPRHRIAEHPELQPNLKRSRTGWHAQVFLPDAILPSPILRYNAFAIWGPPSARQHLCFHPLPGEKPDFHQPERFLEW
jgi:hypothetical protein